jgi:aminopeptidase
LTVGLLPGHLWNGGQSISKSGIPFVANLPTEEIFTLPHKDQVEGFVTATKPLSYGGRIIEGMVLVFSKGRVIEYSAKAGSDCLAELLELDERSASLGEVALIPGSSPLAQLGVVFHNMLFDENASSHLALGSGLRVSLDRAEGLSAEEFALRGGNLSQVHYDFAIGSVDLDIDGITSAGKAEAILRSGEWAFTVSER